MKSDLSELVAKETMQSDFRLLAATNKEFKSRWQKKGGSVRTSFID